MTNRNDLVSLRVLQDVNTIQLNKGANALVDAADWQSLNSHRWYVLEGEVRYAARTVCPIGRRQFKYKVIMHRSIMGNPHDKQHHKIFIDHKNRDGFDNRRSNLRLATHSQNRCNSRKCDQKSSPYKGVYWRKDVGKWGSSIKCCGVRRYLGLFTNQIDAAMAYDCAAAELHGEFARLNNTGESR